jgi:hypothetical protein
VESEGDDPGSDWLDAFAQSRLSPDRFARVEAMVRAAAGTCRSTTAARARDMVRFGSYLACWCDTEYLPLRLDVVLHPDTVEEFVAVLDTAVPPRSVATVASVPRTMSACLLPGITRSGRRAHPARAAKAPYSDAELRELFSCLQRSRSKKRRHDLAALLALGLGTGASGQEAALVRPADVKARPDGFEVAFGPSAPAISILHRIESSTGVANSDHREQCARRAG